MGLFGLNRKKITDLIGGVERQLNPFDGGASYSNPNPAPRVQAPQVQAPQRQGFAPQRQLGGVASPFGGGQQASVVAPQVVAPTLPPQSFMGGIKDIFDANSPQDVAKRQAAGDPASYRDQQIALGNTRPYQNVGAMVAGNTARLFNTAQAAAIEVPNTKQAVWAQLRGDQEDLANTNARIKAYQDALYKDNGGLLGQGTIFKSAQDMRTKGAADLTKDIAATTAGTGLEIMPFTKGAGVSANILAKAPNTAAKVAIKTGSNVVGGAAQDILEQQVSRENYSPSQTLAAAAVGGLLPNAAAVGGYAAKKAKPVVKALGKDFASMNEVGGGQIGKSASGISSSEASKQIEADNLGKFIADPTTTPAEGKVALARLDELSGKTMSAPQVGKTVDTPFLPPKVALKNPPTPVETPKVVGQGSGRVDNTGDVQLGLGGQFSEKLVDKDTLIVRKLRQVEKDTGQTGLVDQFMYDSGNQRGANAIANSKITNDENISKALGGLDKKQTQEFSDYTAARTELHNASNGLPTSRSIDELERTLGALDGEYGGRFAAQNRYYQGVAQDLYANGIISKQDLDYYKSNPDYAHTIRDRTDLNTHQGAGSGYSLSQTIAKKKRTGSSREILPADISAFDYAQKTQLEIQKNKTITNLVKAFEGTGQFRRLKLDELAGANNTVSLLRNGKKEVYEVTDQELHKVIKNLNPDQLSTLDKVIAAPGRVVRAGLTGMSLPFTITNYLKDQMGSAIISKNARATHKLVNMGSGIKQAAIDFAGMQESPLYKKFQTVYGDQTSFDATRNLADAKQISREIRLGGKGKAANRALHPLKTLEDFNSITEKATRFQNFKGMYEKAIKDGLGEAEAMKAGALAARQNSVDFSRNGPWGRTLNLLIPYFNPGIQGTRTYARTIKERPGATLGKTAGLGAAIAATVAWNTGDEKRKEIYNNISEYEKQNNIILIPPGPLAQNPDGSYNVLKLPLPPGPGDVASVGRRVVTKDPVGAVKDVVGAFSGPIDTGSVKQAVSGMIPQTVKPFVQQAMNQDLYRGKQIVPDYVNKAVDADGNPIKESEKVYDFSSGTARGIGKLTNTSPIKVEQFIKDATGKVGLNVLNAADNALNKVGLIPKEQIGGISAKEELSRRLTKASSNYNFNKSDGAKFFEDRATAVKNLKLNDAENGAFESINPSRKTFTGNATNDKTLFDSQDRAATYLRYPKVFETMKEVDRLQRAKGKGGDPLYDLNEDQRKVIFTMQANPSDEPMSKKLGKDNPWLNDFYKKRGDFFDKVKSTQTPEEQAAAGIDPNGVKMVIADDKMQKKLDTLNKLGDKKMKSQFYQDNPDVLDFYKSKDEYDRYKRKAMGFPLYDKYPEPAPEVQKIMNAYNALPKGDGPAKKDGTKSSPARSAWIKGNQEAWSKLTDYYNIKSQYDLAKAGSNAVYEGEGFNADDYKDIQSLAKSSGGSGSGGFGGGGAKSDPTANAYEYAVSLKAGGKAASANVAKPKVAAKTKSAGKVALSKPKVSSKKSMV